MTGLLRRLPALALRYRGLIQREFKTNTGETLSRRLMAWRSGFVSESLVTYSLQERNADDYLSDFARHVRTPDINQRFKAALDNKLIFTNLFGRTLPIPRILYWMDGGMLFRLPDGTVETTTERLLALCREQGRLLIKQADGGGGRNVFVLECRGNEILLNHKPLQPEGVEAFIATRANCIATEFAAQHDYANRIFPQSTNTIRVLTMWDYDKGEPFIAAAVHRFGRNATIPVDNWSQGGLSSEIDMEAGTIGPGVMHPSTGDRDWHSRHPDTGETIKGVEIPHWPAVRSGILKAAASAPYLPYVGWDIVVTNTGYMILEGNNFSDVNLLQVHRPLLQDVRVQKFFQHHGVI